MVECTIVKEEFDEEEAERNVKQQKKE